MNLTAAVALTLSVVPVGLLGIYLVAPSSPFRSLTALVLAVVLIGVLIGVLVTRDRRSAPFDILLVMIICGFFLIRLPALWLAPGMFIYPGLRFSESDVPWTLGYLILGTIAASAGFRLGVRWRPWRRRSPREAAPLLRLPMTRLLALVLVYFAIEMALWIYAGTASTALSGNAPVSGGLLFLRHFISLYAATGIGLVVGLDRWPQLGSLRRVQFCAFIALFVVYTIAAGSRSGLMVLMVFSALYFLIRQGNIWLGPRAVAAMVAVPILLVIIFPAATMIRYGWMSASERGFTLDSSKGLDSNSWLASGLTAGLNRMNGLDPLLIIVSRKEAVPVEKFVSATQVVKSTANLLIPSALLGGEPFPGVLPMSRLFSAVYRGQSVDYINTWYQTDMWTFWGAAFALGGWRWGLVAMFGIAMLLGSGYRRIIRRPGRLSLLFRLWWLYLCYLVLISYGFDVDFAAAFSLFIGGTVVVILLRPKALRMSRMIPTATTPVRA